jgi:hypothetical protein
MPPVIHLLMQKIRILILFFKLQKSALDVEPAAVPDEAAIRTDDSVTRDDDGDRVFIVGHADGPAGLRVPHRRGNVPVRACLTVWDVAQRRPYVFLKRRSGRLERQVKRASLSEEVLRKLIRRVPEERRFPAFGTLHRSKAEFGDGAVFLGYKDLANRRTI